MTTGQKRTTAWPALAAQLQRLAMLLDLLDEIHQQHQEIEAKQIRWEPPA